MTFIVRSDNWILEWFMNKLPQQSFIPLPHKHDGDTYVQVLPVLDSMCGHCKETSGIHDVTLQHSFIRTPLGKFCPRCLLELSESLRGIAQGLGARRV